MNEYGQEYDLQHLEWSTELFENSVDEDLRNKVTEKTFLIREMERGGPLLYYFSIKTILSSTEYSIRSMTTRVAQMKIRDKQGENVSMAVIQIRSEIIQLKTLNKSTNTEIALINVVLKPLFL